jgi:hypothetical protein
LVSGPEAPEGAELDLPLERQGAAEAWLFSCARAGKARAIPMITVEPATAPMTATLVLRCMVFSAGVVWTGEAAAGFPGFSANARKVNTNQCAMSAIRPIRGLR